MLNFYAALTSVPSGVQFLPLMLALKLLRQSISNIQPQEIIMVGDSMERDLVPAKKLGLRTALSKYGQKTAEAGTPDYELTDIEDLMGIL